MIYAIEALGSGHVKIGYCTDLVRLVYRWKQLDTHNSHALTLLGVIWDGSRGEEKGLHVEWLDHWVKGEWFLVSPIRSAINLRFKPCSIDERSVEVANLLKTQKEGDMLLLRDDERFVSLDSVKTLSYSAGQEAWVEAQEQIAAVGEVSQLANKQGRHGAHAWPLIVKLRGEGLTFKAIGERLGKSAHSVYNSYNRIQKRLAKRAA